jgi:conjugal transfer pilin signal peptidase TrbI
MIQSRVLRVFLYLGLVMGLGILSQVVALRWNRTNSLPNTVFLGIKKTPQKGDTVLLDHPLFVAPLAKIIVGTEGDEVVIEHGRVRVNGEDRGEVLEKSPSSGRPLASIRSCSIPKGFVFVWAPHPHSFDSRYQEMGLIPVESIREVLWSLF